MNNEANNQGGAATERINTASLQVIERGGAVQQVGTQYSTAVHVQIPRDLAKVEKRCLIEAELAGDTIYYGWSAGGSQIEGPSIECAMILLRNYGNAALAQRPVVETEKAFIFSSAFVDLETGVTYERQYRQSKKSRVSFKTDEARQDEIRFAIGQSKSDRNVVVRVLPRWLSDKMIAKAKEGVRAKIEKWIKDKGVVKASEVMAKELLKFGVDEDRIVLKYGKVKAKWEAHELTLLSGDLKALQNGYDTPEAIFPLKTIEVTHDVRLTGQTMTIGDPEDHQDHEGEPDEKPEVKPDPAPKQDTATEAAGPNRREILAQIKELETSKFMTYLERSAVKSGFGIENLSRSGAVKLLMYQSKLEKLIAAAEAAPPPESPPEEDRDDLVEEIISLEESSKLSSAEISKIGDGLKMSDDLEECSVDQLKEYRVALKNRPAEVSKPADDTPSINLKEIAELEKKYSVLITATDLGPLRDKHLGGPDPAMATQAELDKYAAVLSEAIKKADCLGVSTL